MSPCSNSETIDLTSDSEDFIPNKHGSQFFKTNFYKKTSAEAGAKNESSQKIAGNIEPKKEIVFLSEFSQNKTAELPNPPAPSSKKRKKSTNDSEICDEADLPKKTYDTIINDIFVSPTHTPKIQPKIALEKIKNPGLLVLPLDSARTVVPPSSKQFIKQNSFSTVSNRSELDSNERPPSVWASKLSAGDFLLNEVSRQAPSLERLPCPITPAPYYYNHVIPTESWMNFYPNRQPANLAGPYPWLGLGRGQYPVHNITTPLDFRTGLYSEALPYNTRPFQNLTFPAPNSGFPVVQNLNSFQSTNINHLNSFQVAYRPDASNKEKSATNPFLGEKIMPNLSQMQNPMYFQTKRPDHINSFLSEPQEKHFLNLEPVSIRKTSPKNASKPEYVESVLKFDSSSKFQVTVEPKSRKVNTSNSGPRVDSQIVRTAPREKKYLLKEDYDYPVDEKHLFEDGDISFEMLGSCPASREFNFPSPNLAAEKKQTDNLCDLSSDDLPILSDEFLRRNNANLQASPKNNSREIIEHGRASVEIAMILAKKTAMRRVSYLIKWKGYDDSYNTWMPKDRMDCDEFIEAFEASIKHKLAESWTVRDGNETIVTLPLNISQFVELFSQDEGPVISVFNDVDDSGPPPNFTAINKSILREGVVKPKNKAIGCKCIDKCKSQIGACSCHNFQRENSYFPTYNAAGLLKLNGNFGIYECNSKCSCSSECRNRVVQRGREVKLQIFKTLKKGWGIRAMQDIKKGTFIIEYIGEVITSDEAERRGKVYDARQATYLFDLDFETGVDEDCPYTIDACYFGNASHFFNHSCDPNMAVFSVFTDSCDAHLHRLAFFATRKIYFHEELTFDYLPQAQSETFNPNVTTQPNKYVCHCESSNCRGVFHLV